MNLGDKALQVIKTVAPLLGTAVGGPFGAIAGTAISAALGSKTGDDAAAETALLAASPEQLVALKKAELDFDAQMKSLGITEEKLAFDDRASARARQAAVKDLTPSVLAYGITVGFFGVLIFMLINGKPATGGDALLVMLGALGGAWASVVAYYFGSSSGSEKKTEALAEIAKQP